ncbi:hypothetical protein MLC59_07820 [Marinobacter bryozoorum]|jgi:hypothetical protein|uniref:hypothetical protein n=1 Tax=Marinobacter bryozoorum TaxID=256324 RepID=UPI0020032F84|nr:hypothetical protein [Marinobacter bryozoorum]MCK7544074.1 hypothetical protein [Marinobacter bryozoorum]
MYPVFKPVENFGSFIGNTVGLMSALSPKGMNPKVAEYWQGIGESFRALGSKVVDALGGDGRAAGEITPALASIVVARKIPDGIQLLDWTRKSPRTGGDAAHHVSRNHGSLNLNKPNQGVFYGNAVEVVNDAWRKAKSGDVTPITVGNRDIYVVPRDNSGFAGGAGGQLQNFNHVTIITEKGTNRVVTAYPSGGTPPLPKNYEFPLLGGE